MLWKTEHRVSSALNYPDKSTKVSVSFPLEKAGVARCWCAYYKTTPPARAGWGGWRGRVGTCQTNE